MESVHTITVRNAFTNMRGVFRAYADAAGVVRVYDAVAGHFTTCHSLTPRQEARVRKLATNGESCGDHNS